MLALSIRSSWLKKSCVVNLLFTKYLIGLVFISVYIFLNLLVVYIYCVISKQHNLKIKTISTHKKLLNTTTYPNLQVQNKTRHNEKIQNPDSPERKPNDSENPFVEMILLN